MEGLFHQQDDYPYLPYEKVGEVEFFVDVFLERDIGPFKANMIIQHASYNRITGEVTLTALDENDEVSGEYKFNVRRTFIPDF